MTAYLDKNAKGFAVKLGFRLRELRLKKNLSQMDVAKKAVMARPTLTMIEGGKQNATLFMLSKIAKVLGVTVDELINE